MNPSAMPMLSVPVNHSDHLSGSHTAKVNVVEYGDFECPSCRQAYPAVKIMLTHLGDKLAFVFRHFPLREVHPHAELAAEPAEAAGAQQKFWHMHDLLFENLKAASLRQYASRAELDLERYDYEMGDHVYLQRPRTEIEITPAWIMRCMADSCATRLTPPMASTTTYIW